MVSIISMSQHKGAVTGRISYWSNKQFFRVQPNTVIPFSLNSLLTKLEFNKILKQISLPVSRSLCLVLTYIPLKVPVKLSAQLDGYNHTFVPFPVTQQGNYINLYPSTGIRSHMSGLFHRPGNQSIQIDKNVHSIKISDICTSMYVHKCIYIQSVKLLLRYILSMQKNT